MMTNRLKTNVFYLLVTMILVLGFTMHGVAAGPITYVVHGDQGKINAYRDLFDKFTAETGIEVEIIHARNAINLKWEMVATYIAGGISPDIVSGVSTEFGTYAFAGYLQPLDPFIERDGLDRGELVSGFVEALQLDGNQYILPYGSSVLNLVYNKNHFNEAGVAAPPPQWGAPNWTWSDFVDTAVRLTSIDGQGRTVRWGVSHYDTNQWQSIPHQFGGRWISPDLSEFLGTSEKTLAALEELQALIHTHGALDPAGRQEGFLNSLGAMAGTGTWLLPRLIESDVDWDFMPWFTYEDSRPQGAIFPVGYGILTTAPHPEEAWQLIKWLTWNSEANLELALAAGAIPSLESNLSAWGEYQMRTTGRGLSIGVIGAQLQHHYAIIDIRKSPAFADLDPVVRRAVNDIWANRKEPRTAMEEIKDQINQMLRLGLQSNQ